MSSVKTHITSFSKILASQSGRSLVTAEVNKLTYLKSYADKVDEKVRWKALEQIIAWFLHNQSNMKDAGFGSYYLHTGWSSSYPETTGYIIPTLLRYAAKNDYEPARVSAENALDWLLEIQKPEGGW